MGAAHADLQVAHRSARRRDEVHVDAQALAEHAARVAHRRAVDRVADRLGMDDVAIGGFRRPVNVLLHPAYVTLPDLVIADPDPAALVVRARPPPPAAPAALAHTLAPPLPPRPHH